MSVSSAAIFRERSQSFAFVDVDAIVNGVIFPFLVASDLAFKLVLNPSVDTTAIATTRTAKLVNSFILCCVMILYLSQSIETFLCMKTEARNNFCNNYYRRSIERRTGFKLNVLISNYSKGFETGYQYQDTGSKYAVWRTLQSPIMHRASERIDEASRRKFKGDPQPDGDVFLDTRTQTKEGKKGEESL